MDSSDLTADNVQERLRHIHGIIIPGGFGVRGVDGKIACIRYVREKKIPYLGLCYGMQLAVIEYARHVCGLPHANSTEIEPDCPQPVIDILPEQQKLEQVGGNMRLGGHDIVLTPDSVVSRLFDDAHRIRLRFRHRYEVNPEYIETLESHGLVFPGKNSPLIPPNQGGNLGGTIMHVLELPADRHPFFVATQAHPELTSRPLRPQPMFVGLVRAALHQSGVIVRRDLKAGENSNSSPDPRLEARADIRAT